MEGNNKNRARIVLFGALVSFIFILLCFYQLKGNFLITNHVPKEETVVDYYPKIKENMKITSQGDVDVGLVTTSSGTTKFEFVTNGSHLLPGEYEVNNYGPNKNLLVRKDRQRDVPKEKLKTILMWNAAYGKKDYFFGHTREPFYEYKCPETRCYTTGDKNYLPRLDMYDAIMFHYPNLNSVDSLKKVRSPHQRYVMFSIEAPQWYPAKSSLNGFFNQTMTFQMNSDYPKPYSRIVKVRDHPLPDSGLEEYIKEFGIKHKHLAGNRSELSLSWLVSNCNSKSSREMLVEEITKYVNVSIYGKCGPLNCENDDGCLSELERKYKFYLSFENALCTDYVTEKFFKILDYDIIPIVFGGANYSAVAPPHSYIDVLDFKSVKEMTDHIVVLHNDDAKFAEYFWWRDFYEIRTGRSNGAQAWCDLCKTLNDPEALPSVYNHLSNYWKTCKRLDKDEMKRNGTVKLTYQ